MYINIELNNGVKLGEWERSELRHLIETIDNKI